MIFPIQFIVSSSSRVFPFYHPYAGYFLPQCGSKRKGGQVRFSPQQTQNLERRFNSHKYLSPEDRRKLAMELNLSDRQVKTWFQNRRWGFIDFLNPEFTINFHFRAKFRRSTNTTGVSNTLSSSNMSSIQSNKSIDSPQLEIQADNVSTSSGSSDQEVQPMKASQLHLHMYLQQQQKHQAQHFYNRPSNRGDQDSSEEENELEVN